jgi:hydrogenase-4 transcriptional activator
MSRNTSLFGVSPASRIRKGRPMTRENQAEIFGQIEEKLNSGRSVEAEKIIIHTLGNFSNSFETQAKLNRFLSFALETQGRYATSLKVLKPFEPEDILNRLKPPTYISVLVQLAISYSNLDVSAKALKLLNTALEYAESNDLNQFFVEIYVALSRVHKKLGKHADSRRFAERGLSYARETGDWYRMAEAYQVIAACFHQDGEYEKSLDYFHQAIKIVGERRAPFLLGKIYSDMSATYWFLRRAHEGIGFLEKAIGLFEETEQNFQATIAYHNLGVNLMLVGEWAKAEETLKRSLELAIETHHAYRAIVLNSLGEIALLRGNFQEAQEAFEQAFSLAEKDQKESYKVQVLRNLARCHLAQEKPDEAVRRAQEAVFTASKIGDYQFKKLADLILAESYLHKNRLREAEKILRSIEEAETESESDFYVLGTVQRVRGLLALAHYDESLAAHHFSRSLSFFETAEDLYHTALAKYEFGRTLGYNQPEKAQKYLASAADAFSRLEAAPMLETTESALEKLKKVEPIRPADQSANSQLLTLRLAEAVASRELLFRELIAVLQQESKAKKIILAEFDERKRFYPLINLGFTPAEGIELVGDLQEKRLDGKLDSFAPEKHLSVFELRAQSAPPATLIVYPALDEKLADGTAIKPLLRVVELGMDVCALREKDKARPSKEAFNPSVSQSMMPGFIHSSPAMAAIVEEVHKIRSSDVTVLITGESGTGKELVSRAIHQLSPRKDKVFIPFNCTAVPKELAEAYFFGYRRGTFTGAVSDSPGMIRSAEGGTLLLDEIGDLPLEIQPKLLRFLQEGEIQPLGEKRPISVDVRIIAATNSSLEEKVEQGTFREDLYYRLNVIRLHVPPLRERRTEIPQIVNYYINHYSTKFARRNINISPKAMDLLTVGDWAGNVRQLCNEIQRLIARADDGETITPDHLSPELRRTAEPIPVKYSGNVRPITSFANILDAPAPSGTLEEAVAELEKKLIAESMRRHAGNISRVARELGLTRRGLYLKLDRYGLDKTGS